MENDNIVIKSKKLKGDDGYRIFSVRIKEDLVMQIDDLQLILDTAEMN